MSLYIVDIHGELEGDYEIIRKYEEPTTKNDLGDEYISRSELMAILSDYYDTTVEYRSMLKEIASLPSVIPQEPRWIPVSERLPEENRTVIASAEYGFYPEARYTKEDGWEWAYESGAEYWVEIESDVLAWMPLPKPYEPQESEEV